MTHNFYNKAHTYLMQIPYLNDGGNARVVTITSNDARELTESGSHQLLRADADLYVVTPIQSPATNHVYQIGQAPV